jgi:PAS domain-containing protein
MKESNETYYAPAKRTDIEKLKEQKAIFEKLPQLSFFLDTVHTIYLILNEDRQIIFANKIALDTLGFENIDSILGLRPGEAINCLHAKELPGGCGTSESCQHCGAVNAILNGLRNQTDIQECRITTDESKSSFDFRVWTSPYIVDGQKFVIFSVADISDEKRRRALERIFFHDVLNTAGGIKGISSLIQDFPEEVTEFKDILYDSSNQLINEILAQRDIANAENNELSTHIVNVNSKKVVDFLVGIYSSHETAKNKFVVADPNYTSIDFNTDEALLLRVLGNMTKNALEATNDGQTVTINCYASYNQHLIFSVHNPNFMPRNIQLQVFQRSFSTKGSNRGLGTYSMKLLSEKYLKGKVYFSTDSEEGTTFFGEYPVKFEE